VAQRTEADTGLHDVFECPVVAPRDEVFDGRNPLYLKPGRGLCIECPVLLFSWPRALTSHPHPSYAKQVWLNGERSKHTRECE
jgi:hypothetical protein